MVFRLFGQTFAAGAVLAFAVAAPFAHAAPATDALIAEIGTALETGDAAHAVQLADEGLKTDATALQRGRLLLDRGLAQELLGDQQAALVDFTAALQTRALPPTERAQVLLQRGFLLDGENKLEDAAQDYGAVISLRAGAVATALNNRANIRRRQNKLAEAKRDYLAALAAGSEKPQYPYFGLGQIAEAQQDTEAARGFYAKAVAADPGYSLAADRLAALGGPPDGILNEPDKIVLHPPESTPAPPPAEKPMTLHAPKSRAARAPVGAASPGLRPALDGPTEGQGLEVQLGAWRSEPEAQAAWDKVRAKAGEAVAGLSAHIVQADLPGKGRYFRLRLSTPEPGRLCEALRAAGQECARVR